MGSQIEKAGNFALFFNFLCTILVFAIRWDGSGTVTFYIPEGLPFGDNQRLHTLNMFTIVIGIVVVLLIVVGVLGIQIFGTGLQDSSVNYMSKLITKTIVYIVCSIFTLTILSLIGDIGVLLYWILTFLFIMGLLETMVNKGDSE